MYHILGMIRHNFPHPWKHVSFETTDGEYLVSWRMKHGKVYDFKMFKKRTANSTTYFEVPSTIQNTSSNFITDIIKELVFMVRKEK